MNYEQDMKIDETSLDVEWLDQPLIAIKYGKIWAQCKKKLSEAEEEIKVTRSELIKEANENPDKHLGEDVKPTGPNVEAYYRTHERHKDAKQNIIDLQFELDNAEIAKGEVSYTRKAALENLVKLHGQLYFAGPSIPRDLNKEWEEREKQKRLNTRIGKKLIKRTK